MRCSGEALWVRLATERGYVKIAGVSARARKVPDSMPWTDQKRLAGS
jgi:hypothetical protein